MPRSAASTRASLEDRLAARANAWRRTVGRVSARDRAPTVSTNDADAELRRPPTRDVSAESIGDDEQPELLLDGVEVLVGGALAPDVRAGETENRMRRALPANS